MGKNPHFAVEDLSEEARRIIRNGIERNDREQAIRQRVAEQTKEKIASSSLNRYACWCRARMRRREAISERMEAAVKTAASLGQELQDAVQAELLDVLFDAAQEGKLGEIGPTGAARLALAFQENARRDREVAVKEQLVGVREREIVILEKKLGAAEERERSAQAELEAAAQKMERGEQPTIADINRMRAVYNLKPLAQVTEGGSSSGAGSAENNHGPAEIVACRQNSEAGKPAAGANPPPAVSNDAPGIHIGDGADA